MPDYLAGLVGRSALSVDAPDAGRAVERVRSRLDAPLGNKGSHRPEWFHRRLGDILYEHCGVSRDEAGLVAGLREVRELA